MLSISSPLKGDEQVNYYLNLPQEDYYTAGDEASGYWAGQGAQQLALHGRVERATFRHLLYGLSPDGSKALVQNALDDNRQCAWDLVFSAPKSVSVLWGLAPPELRREIELLHQQAVRLTLNDIEERSGLTRRGKGGHVWEKAALTFAVFQHGSSRALDPDLHSHCLLVNLGVRKDGTTGTLVTKRVFKEKKKTGGRYRNYLARLLIQHFAVKIVPEKVGFHVVGVLRRLCRHFSKRRRAVEQKMESEGWAGPIAAKRATLETRPAKVEVPREVLQEKWRQQADLFGWSTEQVVALLRHQPAASRVKPSDAGPMAMQGQSNPDSEVHTDPMSGEDETISETKVSDKRHAATVSGEELAENHTESTRQQPRSPQVEHPTDQHSERRVSSMDGVQNPPSVQDHSVLDVSQSAVQNRETDPSTTRPQQGLTPTTGQSILANDQLEALPSGSSEAGPPAGKSRSQPIPKSEPGAISRPEPVQSLNGLNSIPSTGESPDIRTDKAQQATHAEGQTTETSGTLPGAVSQANDSLEQSLSQNQPMTGKHDQTERTAPGSDSNEAEQQLSSEHQRTESAANQPERQTHGPSSAAPAAGQSQQHESAQPVEITAAGTEPQHLTPEDARVDESKPHGQAATGSQEPLPPPGQAQNPIDDRLSNAATSGESSTQPASEHEKNTAGAEAPETSGHNVSDSTPAEATSHGKASETHSNRKSLPPPPPKGSQVDPRNESAQPESPGESKGQSEQDASRRASHHRAAEEKARQQSEDNNGQQSGTGPRPEAESERQQKSQRSRRGQSKHDSGQKTRPDDHAQAEEKNRRQAGNGTGQQKSSGRGEQHDQAGRRDRTSGQDRRRAKAKSQDQGGANRATGFRPPNPRWGKIQWEKKCGFLSIARQERFLFPNAPSWSPFHGLKLNALHVTIRPEFLPGPPAPRWWGISWKKDLKWGELRLQERNLFRHAPKWSPFHGIKQQALHLTAKKSKWTAAMHQSWQEHSR